MNKTKLVVDKPTNRDLQDAQMEYNIKMAQLMRADNKLMSRSELQKYLVAQKIWTQEDEDLMCLVQTQLRNMEKKLAEGGIKREEGKDIAIQMKYNRSILLALTNRKTQMDSLTMEFVAENHRFKFLMTRCIKDDDGNTYVTTIEQCDEKENDEAFMQAASKLNSTIYGYDPDFFDKLAENEWLKEFGYMNKEGRLANPDGKPIKVNGKLINDDGRYVDKDHNLVDVDGNRVDEEGRFIIENPKPFLDDDGNPIETKKKKKKKAKKKTVKA